MNRQLWDSFLQQIDAQVEGDFIALATEYEAVMGHPFHVDKERHVLYSMLDQAMRTQHASLLKHTVDFIAQLPQALQKEFREFGRDNIHLAARGHHRVERQARVASYR